MKLLYAIVMLLLCAGTALNAQRQSDLFPDKQHTDSLFGSMLKVNRMFELANPGATIINRSSRGTIYNMPLDNMAVLVPDMRIPENMPGSNPQYQPAPPSKMPNPLYPPGKKLQKQ